MTKGRSRCGGWTEVPRGEELVASEKQNFLPPCFLPLFLPPSPLSLHCPPPNSSPPHSLWCCHPGNSFLSSSISSGLFQWKLGAEIQQPGKEALQLGKPAQCTVQKQCVSADRDGRRAQWRHCKYQNLTSIRVRPAWGSFSWVHLEAGHCSSMHARRPFCLSPSSYGKPSHTQKAIYRCLPTAWGSSSDQFSSLSTAPQPSPREVTLRKSFL